MASLHVYVHFPWCLEKCPYCDFVSFKTERPLIDHEGYADAVIREVEARAGSTGLFSDGGDGAPPKLSSVFLGGGTPSLWSPASIGRVLRAIERAFPGGDRVEITAECNPTSLDDDRAGALVDAGVNRLSVGVQSLDAKQLAFLGRLHDVPMALSAVRSAIATGARVSADLIFGLPNQPAADAARHAAELVDLGLAHLSAYSLTIEQGTRFGELARRGKLPLAAEDDTCDAFLAIEETLATRGLRHYEVSNYARAGEESRHNLGYWRGATYVGLGCAAYGFGHLPGARPRAGVRYRNDPDPRGYVEGTRALATHVTRTGDALPVVGDGVTSTVEPLDVETLVRERIMLGLRLADGLDLDRTADELSVPRDAVWTIARRRTVERLANEGALTVEGARLVIPAQRRLATDGIAARLF
jgi:putative oxygen-independent coproporphyrinogen III oxidase